MTRTMKKTGTAWIREIPADWAVVNIRALFSFGKGLPITKENLRKKGAPVVSYGQIHSKQNNGLEIKPDLVRYVDASYFQSNPESLVKQNDFIFADTSEDLDGCGNCVYVDSKDPVFAGYHTIILRNKTDLNLKYFAFLFQSDAWRKQIRERVTGVKLFSISQRILRETSLLLPPVEEQRRIVRKLSAECARIDSIIEQTRATVEEYKKLKQSIITQAVTKGIRPNRPMKDSGIEWIGKIPEEWEVQRFKNVTKINGRIGFRGYTTDDLVSEGEGAITLSPSNIVDLKIIYEKCSYISWEKYNESPEIQIQNGDVIFVKTGSSYGKSGIVNDLPLQATINPQLVVFKEISTDHRYFLYFLQTQSVRNEIEGIVSGGTIPTMAQEKMKNFHICVPPEREQKEIADHIDLRVAAINDIIEKKLSFIVELGSYKKSLIYEYVTGKKEAC